MPRTLWRIDQPDFTGVEVFGLDEGPDGAVLRGRVVGTIDGAQFASVYEVITDPDWVTRRVSVVCNSAARTMLLEHDGSGTWVVDGITRTDLTGCLDVDLGITPSTNTLPIRRLGLAVGDSADLQAAWVRFPEMTVQMLTQSYERTGDRSYRYWSPGFEADLTVDDHGVVTEYGEGLWVALKQEA